MMSAMKATKYHFTTRGQTCFAKCQIPEMSSLTTFIIVLVRTSAVRQKAKIQLSQKLW